MRCSACLCDRSVAWTAEPLAGEARRCRISVPDDARFGLPWLPRITLRAAARRAIAPGRGVAAHEARVRTIRSRHRAAMRIAHVLRIQTMGVPGGSGIRSVRTRRRLSRTSGGCAVHRVSAACANRSRDCVARRAHDARCSTLTRAKARADQLLVDRGLAESRAKAQALILAGLVFSGERKIDKAGQALAADAALEVRGKDHPWVSRGGIKLAHGLDHFGWDVTGAVALDVGISTGGFTDVLLAARRREGVRGRRRHQPARLEAAPGSARDRPRADQRPLSDRGDRHRASRHHRLRRQLHRRLPRCSTPRSISPGPAAA